jgi:hypothetical protein
MRRSAALALAALALALVACDGYGDDDEPSSTEAPEVTATTSDDATSTPSTSGVNEFGEEPVFWRTIDEFKSLRAREPYFVVIRVTGGYSEPTLRIRAEPVDALAQPFAFDVLGAEPTGPDAEGRYFPTNIEVPAPGTWMLIVEVGALDVPLEVTALQ